jgi:hypothetical protein
VPYGQSDLDLVAIHPELKSIELPGSRTVGPRLIIETKDEHDFDPSGREFGKYLLSDASQLGNGKYVPIGSPGKIKFSMLRQAHFDVACQMFGTDDFDRIFVVHAVDPSVLQRLEPMMTCRRVHWLTIRDIVLDLQTWYRGHPRPAGLRYSFVGDMWHLLFGYCGVALSGA